MSRACKENACLAVSQSVAFTIHHPYTSNKNCNFAVPQNSQPLKVSCLFKSNHSDFLLREDDEFSNNVDYGSQFPTISIQEPTILFISGYNQSRLSFHVSFTILSSTTGTGKSTVYKFLQNLLKAVRTELDDSEISYKKWTLSDQTFEKLGELMYQNDSKALGLYDELTNFLS